MESEPFHSINIDKWSDLKREFKLDWPRGITGFYALQYLEKMYKMGYNFGFRVLNPFGKARNGIVAVKDEDNFSKMLIECPQNDTSELEEALRCTKLINRNKDIVIIYPSKHVIECIRRVAGDINMKFGWEHPLKQYILDKDTSLYDISLPPGLTFKLLTEDYINLVDSTWPHRYPGSTKYFQLLIRSKSGYGLFKEDKLVSFGFVKEIGALCHLYTLEEHRRKGYGEIVTKSICNEILKEGNDVYSFCVEGNVQSCNMHKKFGFTEFDTVSFIQLKCK